MGLLVGGFNFFFFLIFTGLLEKGKCLKMGL